ncbi:MAG: type II toxin-antitoxin system HicA family toxin [Chloroflexi bacterium]|nr:type II toxin-antitoxin system HicA family toxin [Chloroflexota bacterium]MBI3763921.1 type II toxin-antitoxin system HicA family toxin [Chloroflexota bacterium]
MTYRELTRKLRRLGYELYRQAKGSHEIWWSPKTRRRTTIPNHGSNPIPKGTLRRILKDLGLTQEDLK